MTESANTQQQTQFKILLVGDECLDIYNIGTVDRLSPEAPVPILQIKETHEVAGMAANVFENLLKLGVTVSFFSNKEIIKKTRYIDSRSGQQLLRVDNEPDVTRINLDDLQSATDYDAVVISDYDKGFLRYEDIEYIIETTEKPVFIDTKKTDLYRFNRYNVYVKINELEYSRKVSSNDKLIVTKGSKGALYIKNQTEKLYPTKPAEITDVCGCGDTFLSALSYQFLVTGNISSAISFANRAASITVQHRGNYAPSLNEIKNA
jgi:bifunctional ADP-heptose synthase (sugar kinase/adenylyltransferase)